MAAEALRTQHGGGGDVDVPVSPVDFWDPNKKLIRHNGLVVGRLASFGTQEYDLKRFDPDRGNTGMSFVPTEQKLGDIAMARMALEDNPEAAIYRN